MKNRKYTLTLLLTLLLTLTACKNKDTAEIHTIDFQPAPAYESEYISLPVPTGDLIGCCTDGEYMYILADEKTGDEVHSVLCRVSLPDGAVTELTDYQSPEAMERGFTNRLGPILAPDGTLWVYEIWTMIQYDLPEDFDPEKGDIGKYYTGRDDFHHLRQLDPVTGREKKLVDISGAIQELDIADFFSVSGFMVDSEGNIFVAGTGGVSAVDSAGNRLFTLRADMPYHSLNNTDGGALALLPDGRAAVLTSLPGGKREVRVIDVASKGWSAERYEVPGGVDLIYSGTNGFLFYYISAGALWAWEPEAEEGRLLTGWTAADLSGSRACFTPLNGGKLAVLTLTQNGTYTDKDYWYNADIRLSMLSPIDKLPEEQRTRLVYGTIGTNSVLRSRINQFNSENEDYYIEIRNYAGENTERNDVRADAREAALKLLSAEVVSGQIPDIWDSSLPVDLYARKGILEDLWPYIDNDPEISREDLMSHVLDCASVDGKLYKIFNTFEICTAAAPAEAAGTRTGWTLDEMMDCYEALPEGSSLIGYGYDKVSLLYNLIYNNINDWIDWSTGECRFDSESFKNLLAMCGRLGEDAEGEFDMEQWSREASGTDIRAGRQLFADAFLSSPSDLLVYDAMMGGPQCVMDYEAYLNENNIFATLRDEDGNERDENALLCPTLNKAAVRPDDRKLMGYYDVAPDAVTGAVEGGGYAVYVGMPSDRGAGSRFILPDWYTGASGLWGISAACQAKEGAWAYIRQFLLPSGGGEVVADDVRYMANGFPINKADFEAMFAPVWFQREDGEYVLDRDGRRIENPQDITWVPNRFFGAEITMILYQLAPNELQMERFWDLYNAIDSVEGSDSTIMDMIQDQAAVYFAGDKSLDETAELIQRRAALYVNENR